MQQLLREAMQAGAHGFSTSQLEIHQAHDGRPVPSNLASDEEVIALCAVLAEFDRGAIEIIPRSFAEGYDERDRVLLHRMSEVSGKPIDLNPVVWFPNMPDGWVRSMEFIEEQAAQGLRLYPMYGTQQGGAYFSLDTTFLFDDMPAFREPLLLSEPERSAALRDPLVRKRMREELAGPPMPSFPLNFDITTVYAVDDPASLALGGPFRGRPGARARWRPVGQLLGPLPRRQSEDDVLRHALGAAWGAEGHRGSGDQPPGHGRKQRRRARTWRRSSGPTTRPAS